MIREVAIILDEMLKYSMMEDLCMQVVEEEHLPLDYTADEILTALKDFADLFK